MKKQKKMAVINDFSGFGRCSLAVSIPIISAMKIQCCAMPTAVFSNHTGYENYFFDDYTDKMRPYYAMWEKLGLEFDGIYTGFLGSVRQVEIVADFLRKFKRKHTCVVVDPVMGDNGKPYATFDRSLCYHIRQLLPLADVITPNLTEACMLSDMPYHGERFSYQEIFSMARKLFQTNGCRVIITGIKDGNNIACFICHNDREYSVVKMLDTGTARAGTGDVFASIIAADCVNGVPLEESVRKAADFVRRAVLISDQMNVPIQDGVCFEEILGDLL